MNAPTSDILENVIELITEVDDFLLNTASKSYTDESIELHNKICKWRTESEKSWEDWQKKPKLWPWLFLGPWVLVIMSLPWWILWRMWL